MISRACDVYEIVPYFHLFTILERLNYAFALYYEIKMAGGIIDCEMAILSI